jgi:hypothetical protein
MLGAILNMHLHMYLWRNKYFCLKSFAVLIECKRNISRFRDFQIQSLGSVIHIDLLCITRNVVLIFLKITFLLRKFYSNTGFTSSYSFLQTFIFPRKPLDFIWHLFRWRPYCTIHAWEFENKRYRYSVYSFNFRWLNRLKMEGPNLLM